MADDKQDLLQHPDPKRSFFVLPKPFAVSTEDGGTLHMRPVVVGDIQSLAELNSRNLNPHSFAREVFQQQLVIDDGDSSPVDHLSEKNLETIARQFLGHPSSQINATILEGENPVIVLQEAAAEELEKLTRRAAEVANSLLSTFTQEFATIQPIIDAVAGLTESVATQISTIVASMTDLIGNISVELNNELYRRIVRAETGPGAFELVPGMSKFFVDLSSRVQAAEALRPRYEHGIDFLWKIGLLSTLDLQKRAEDSEPDVTAALALLVSGQDFKIAFLAYVDRSTVLVRRKLILDEALSLFQERRYMATVSVLIPQIEGLIADIMEIAQSAERRNGSWRKLNDDGTTGGALGNLDAKHKLLSNLDQDQDFYSVETRSYIAKSLVRFRDRILHGFDTEFGTVEFATELVLVAASLIKTAHEIELAIQSFEESERVQRASIVQE